MYNILTVEQYFELYPEMKQDDWFNRCIKPYCPHGTLETGVLQFPEDYGAVGCGFTGNCSVYSIVDYSKVLEPKGRKRIETENGVDYVDSPDMHDLIPYELKTSKELIEQELFNNKKSVFTYPYRFRERYEDALITYVNGEKCTKTEYEEDILRVILSELTDLEWRQVLQEQHSITWSLESVTKEFPIRLRIDGSDDGAVEGIFKTYLEAQRQLKFQSYNDSFKSPFFYTD